MKTSLITPPAGRASFHSQRNKQFLEDEKANNFFRITVIKINLFIFADQTQKN